MNKSIRMLSFTCGHLLACVFNTIFSVSAGALNPIAFSASTRKTYSDFSFRLSMQYCKQYVSSVTTRVHLMVDESVDRRFSTMYPSNSEPPSLNGFSHSMVTLLLLMVVAIRFCGGEGGANFFLKTIDIN